MVEVSVVVPTHNRQHLLPEAIKSILQQDGVSLELIVVNDGSSDGTGPWLDGIVTTDSRIKVVHHERPRFMSVARNAGIALASGRWIAFCDDDDLWAPNKLIAQLRALRATAASWACSGVVVVDEALEIVGHYRVKSGPVLRELLAKNVIPTGSSVIADASLVNKVGGFDPDLFGSEDWDMWIRLARHSPLAAVDRPLIAYRLGRQSMSMDVNRMRSGRATIVDRYAGLATECEVQPDAAMHERYLAKQLLRAGFGRKAASIFVSLAVTHKQWRELPRAATALIAPRLTDRIGTARATAAVPAEWRREADAWLRCVHTAHEPHLVDDRNGRS